MKCFIEPLAALKMKYYVSSVDAEISGVGKTHMIGEDIYVEDVIIFKQKCTSAHTDIDQEDEMKVMYERDLRGESSKDWNLWWHSHSRMGVFWSGTDTQNIEDQASNGSYLLSIVTNNKGDFKTRFDIFPKDASPLKVITSVLVEDDIETVVLGNNYNPEREAELLTLINEMELLKETNEKSLEESYSAKIKEAEEQIVAWTEVIDDANKEKDEKIKEYNDETDELNKDIIEEYTGIASQELLDDDALKESIKAEVLEKVTVPTYANTKGLSKFLNFGKNNSYKMSSGYDYDYNDYDDYGVYGYGCGKNTTPPPIEDVPTDDDDDNFMYKILDVKTSQYLDEDNYPHQSQELPLHTDDAPDFLDGGCISTFKKEETLTNTTIRNQKGEQIGFKIS